MIDAEEEDDSPLELKSVDQIQNFVHFGWTVKLMKNTVKNLNH